MAMPGQQLQDIINVILTANLAPKVRRTFVGKGDIQRIVIGQEVTKGIFSQSPGSHPFAFWINLPIRVLAGESTNIVADDEMILCRDEATDSSVDALLGYVLPVRRKLWQTVELQPMCATKRR